MKRSTSLTLRLLAAMLVLAAALATAALVFLTRFDLNSYRQPLEQHLTEALGQPVRLGETHLTFHRGLSIDFRDGEIGRTGGSVQVLIPHLYARIRIWPLLWGQVEVDRLQLRQPQLRLRLTETEGKALALPLGTGGASLELHGLEISNGTLQLQAAHRPELYLTNLNLRLHSTDSASRLEITALLRQAGQPASLLLNARLPPLDDLSAWRSTLLQTDVKVQHLNLRTLGRWYAELPPGALPTGLDLELTAAGRPRDGVTVSASGRTFWAAKASPEDSEALAVKLRWRSAAEAETVDDLELRAGATQVAGHLSLRHAPRARLAGELSGPLYDLGPACHLLLPADVVKRLSGARLRHIRLAVDGPLPRTPAEVRDLVTSATAEVELDRLTLEGGVALARLQAHLDYTPLRLKVERGKAELLSRTLTFSGQVQQPGTAAAQVTAALNGVLDAAELPKHLSQWPERLRIWGEIPFQLRFAGRTDQWALQSKADLASLAADWPQLLHKAQRLPGQVELHLDSRHQLRAHLDLPPLKWAVTGSFRREEKGRLSLDLSSEPLDLKTARSFSPLLDEMRFRGRLAAELHLQRTADGWAPLTGELTADRVGIHLWGVVADFNGIRARAQLAGRKLTIPSATARWGRSPVRAKGEIPDLSSPVARLDFTIPRMRAREIIFRSPDAWLRKLSGTIRIRPDGLDFAPVRVRLDGGTRAVVTGTMRSFIHPVTDLQVNAGYGDIQEVIGLFVGPAHSPATAHAGPPVYGPVTVKVRLKSGKLGSLRLKQAVATVRNADRQVLVDPLQFRTEGGTVEGRVRYDYNGRPPYRLEVSGRAHQLDAEQLQQRFFKEAGLVSGTLDGSFSVSGRGLGKAYLASSRGAVRLDLKKGVLRKFQVLSKVFSLLNVSQIFKGHLLPDMARKGMPFNRLTASLDLHRGVLSTEDLLIDSEAMNLSAVGSLNLNTGKVDAVLGVKPLVTVDRIITHIPLVGWLLAGEDKALITANFQVKGDRHDPEVTPVPLSSLSGKVQGIFKRVLKLPGTLVTDPGKLFGIGTSPEAPPEDGKPAKK